MISAEAQCVSDVHGEPQSEIVIPFRVCYIGCDSNHRRHIVGYRAFMASGPITHPVAERPRG